MLCRREPEVAEWVKLLQMRYAGMRMIVGRDKLDEIQGVRHKIRSFEVFLEKYPEFQGKASKILHGVGMPISQLTCPLRWYLFKLLFKQPRKTNFKGASLTSLGASTHASQHLHINPLFSCTRTMLLSASTLHF